jgi:hypothetical protein
VWLGILMLHDSGSGAAGKNSGHALEASVTALTIFSALATNVCRERERGADMSVARLGFLQGGGEAAGGGGGGSDDGSGWEVARASAHVLLLADVLSLHGQEQLQARAMETAAALASAQQGGGGGSGGGGGVEGHSDAAQRAGAGEVECGGGGAGGRDLTRLALAVECALAGLPTPAGLLPLLYICRCVCCCMLLLLCIPVYMLLLLLLYIPVIYLF